MTGAHDCGKITVTLIDSGINTQISNLSMFVKNRTSLKLGARGKIYEEGMDYTHEHGTAIALTVRHLCENACFNSINIFDENLNSDGRILLYALNKALEDDSDIIHLSLGTEKLRYKFSMSIIAKKASKKNKIIVAAANNHGRKSYPASLKSVLGVKGIKFKDIREFEFIENYFYAPPDITEIKGSEELKCSDMQGNSIAAAFITGHICNMLCTSQNKKENEIQRIINKYKKV